MAKAPRSWYPLTATRAGTVSGVRVATGRNEIRTVDQRPVVFSEVECFGPYCGPETGLRRIDWVRAVVIYREDTRTCMPCASSRRPITGAHLDAAHDAAKAYANQPTTLVDVTEDGAA